MMSKSWYRHAHIRVHPARQQPLDHVGMPAIGGEHQRGVSCAVCRLVWVDPVVVQQQLDQLMCPACWFVGAGGSYLIKSEFQFLLFIFIY